MTTNIDKVILKQGALSHPMFAQPPFLFAVWHKDLYPNGNHKMEAPRIGNGSDFNPSAPYRMYHGRSIPGFPKHPHRGFETLTCTLDGFVDHVDSVGNSGRYGNGDLQWMTAGSGIQHSEMFPLIHQTESNPLRLFQVWLNLPKKSKMVKPTQKMHWSEEIPHFKKDNVDVTIWAGKFGDKTALAPCPDSWAADPSHDVGVFLVKLQPGGSIALPKTKKNTNRTLYHFQLEFQQLEGVPELLVNTQSLALDQYAVVKDEAEIELKNTGKTLVSVFILQGQPFDEPVVQYGPFVMSSKEEIMQAFQDYHETEFGGWPCDSDGVVFPREKGRFLNNERPPEGNKN